jgi:hypothetical protein
LFKEVVPMPVGGSRRGREDRKERILAEAEERREANPEADKAAEDRTKREKP